MCHQTWKLLWLMKRESVKVGGEFTVIFVQKVMISPKFFLSSTFCNLEQSKSFSKQLLYCWPSIAVTSIFNLEQSHLSIELWSSQFFFRILCIYGTERLLFLFSGLMEAKIAMTCWMVLVWCQQARKGFRTLSATLWLRLNYYASKMRGHR